MTTGVKTDNTQALFDEQLCKTPMLIPPALKKLLSTVKKLDSVDTLDKVLEATKEYIYQKQLFDSKNPVLINTASDELGKVLGCESFSLMEIKKLVFRQLLAENRDSYPKLLAIVNEVPAGSKRRNTSTEGPSAGIEEKYICDDKRLRRVLCDSTSLSDAEKKKVESPSDSNISFSGNIVAEMYDVECEIETDNSFSDSSSFTDSDSEIEDILHVAALTEIALCNDSDEAFLADESSTDEESSKSSDESDEEISNTDNWVCKTCQSLNKPTIRFCMKCFEERNEWVMEKDLGQIVGERTKRRKRSCVNEGNRKEEKITSEEAGSSTANQDSDEELCIICCSREKKAVIVHGKTGHRISCYRCARRLFNSNKKCPVCRRPIDRVITLDC